MYHWPSEAFWSQVHALVRKLAASPVVSNRSGKVAISQSFSALLMAALADSQAPRLGNGVSVSWAAAALGTPSNPRAASAIILAMTTLLVSRTGRSGASAEVSARDHE